MAFLPIAFLDSVSTRRGHFLLESGHHSGLWLDLDPLFADTRQIEPFVSALAEQLRSYEVAVVCGPLVGGAFLAQLIATVLDVKFSFTERTLSPQGDGLFQARYRLPHGYADLVRGKRVAMVDDVMSAGSALRGTYAELQAHGAEPVVAGALLVLGSRGSEFFAEQGIPVEAVSRESYDLWLPDACPLCARGLPLEDVTTPSA
jgi:orotate phosphoribosyltransferase